LLPRGVAVWFRRTHIPSATPTANWTNPSTQPPSTINSVLPVMMGFDLMATMSVGRSSIQTRKYPLKA
jgi:hypothetical protein